MRRLNSVIVSLHLALVVVLVAALGVLVSPVAAQGDVEPVTLVDSYNYQEGQLFAVVLASRVNVRETPAGRVLGALPYGTVVRVLPDEYREGAAVGCQGWVSVRTTLYYEDADGYMCSTYNNGNQVNDSVLVAVGSKCDIDKRLGNVPDDFDCDPPTTDIETTERNDTYTVTIDFGAEVRSFDVLENGTVVVTLLRR